jgi:surface protein
MFQNASSFNQPLGKWDVGNVQDMTNMFQGASSFKQNKTWHANKVNSSNKNKKVSVK